MDTSATSSSAMTTEPDGVSRRRAVRSASAWRGISWSPSKIVTRSIRPEMPGPEASVTANVTRPDRLACPDVPLGGAGPSGQYLEAYQVGELP